MLGAGHLPGADRAALSFGLPTITRKRCRFFPTILAAWRHWNETPGPCPMADAERLEAHLLWWLDDAGFQLTEEIAEAAHAFAISVTRPAHPADALD